MCGKVHRFLDKKNLSAPYVRTVWTSEATTDTMDITSIPPHTTLLAKNESLKWIIEDFKVSVTRDMKGVLEDDLYYRYIGGPGFVQANIIFPKLDEIISQNKVTKNQSKGEKEEQVLHLVEYWFSSEDSILIVLEEEIDND